MVFFQPKTLRCWARPRGSSFLMIFDDFFHFFSEGHTFFLHGGAECSGDGSVDAEKYQLSGHVWVCRGIISAFPTQPASRYGNGLIIRLHYGETKFTRLNRGSCRCSTLLICHDAAWISTFCGVFSPGTLFAEGSTSQYRYKF